MPNPLQRAGAMPVPGQLPDLQQLLRSQNRLFSTPSARSMQQTAGDEPLILELTGPTVGSHWVISYVIAMGQFRTRTLVAGVDSPVAGLFLVPEQGAEPFGDTQADATAAGWNINARGVPIPCEWKSIVLNVGGFAFSCSSKLTLPLVVPTGYTVRLIATVAPGTATPGPGVGSFGSIQGWGAAERDL